MRQPKKILAAILCSGATAAQAVYLDPDGLGQALIYPYYTARADSQGNPYNTYLSVTNTDSAGKVVRVRLRDAAYGVETASFNVFLAPNDMWTGAVIPEGAGATLVSADRSCTEPALAERAAGTFAIVLQARNPGPGEDAVALAREGYVEMIEMASIKAGSPTALAIAGSANCAHVRTSPASVTPDLDAPRGGLMGGLTLINVASGSDATINAEALGALTMASFFRPGTDPYVDFDAAEVTPVSVVTAEGKRYRLDWSRGVDAVSSVLMRSATRGEYVLDTGTASLDTWQLTMPTRRFYWSGGTATAPFRSDARLGACDTYDFQFFDRETRGFSQGGIDFAVRPADPPAPRLCGSAPILSLENDAQHMAALFASEIGTVFHVTGTFQNGWGEITHDGRSGVTYSPPLVPMPGLVSLPSSTVTEAGRTISRLGSFRLLGLPVVGFSVRTFSNGTLTCAGGTCGGNYASAFPHRAVRQIEVAP